MSLATLSVRFATAPRVVAAAVLLATPTLAAAQSFPESPPPLPAPASELAVHLPAALMRMTTWKAVGRTYAFINAAEMPRAAVSAAGLHSVPTDSTRRPPTGAHHVQLSSAAVAEAETLLAVDSTVQRLVRDHAVRHARPAHATLLLRDTVSGVESYMIRSGDGAAQRITTAVLERVGLLESVTTVLEARVGNEWWRRAVIARVFDADGVESVVISQYGARAPAAK